MNTPEGFVEVEGDREKVERSLKWFAEQRAEIERMKTFGGVDLSEEAREEEPQFNKDVGIVNRQTARRAGLRNPKKPRTMAVPKRRK